METNRDDNWEAWLWTSGKEKELQCNELNRGHPTFFCQSQDELRTKESEFVHFWTNQKRGTCGEKLFISINENITNYKYSLLGATNFQN